jgi:hypothetical protein
MQLLFKILFKYKISLIFRSYSLVGYFIITIFEGKTIFFCYLLTSQTLFMLNLSFNEKI